MTKPNNRKPKKLASEIVDSGLDYALYQQPDAKKRIKAYRLAAEEFHVLAAQMEFELDEL